MVSLIRLKVLVETVNVVASEMSANCVSVFAWIGTGAKVTQRCRYHGSKNNSDANIQTNRALVFSGKAI